MMPNGKTSPREAFSRILKIAATFSNEMRHQLAEAYKEYLDTLPPEHRNMMMCIMVGGKVIAVRRSEIPQKILEDDEFLNYYLMHLGEIAKRARR